MVTNGGSNHWILLDITGYYWIFMLGAGVLNRQGHMLVNQVPLVCRPFITVMSSMCDIPKKWPKNGWGLVHEMSVHSLAVGCTLCMQW